MARTKQTARVRQIRAIAISPERTLENPKERVSIKVLKIYNDSVLGAIARDLNSSKGGSTTLWVEHEVKIQDSISPGFAAKICALDISGIDSIWFPRNRFAEELLCCAGMMNITQNEKGDTLDNSNSSSSGSDKEHDFASKHFYGSVLILGSHYSDIDATVIERLEQCATCLDNDGCFINKKEGPTTSLLPAQQQHPASDDSPDDATSPPQPSPLHKTGTVFPPRVAPSTLLLTSTSSLSSDQPGALRGSGYYGKHLPRKLPIKKRKRSAFENPSDDDDDDDDEDKDGNYDSLDAEEDDSSGSSHVSEEEEKEEEIILRPTRYPLRDRFKKARKE